MTRFHSPFILLTRVALGCAVALAAACGPKTVFGLSSDDNNAEQLARALRSRAIALAPTVSNTLGKPLVLAVVSGTPRQLVAFDPDAGAILWKVEADVQSRVAIAGPLVVAREGNNVVVRDIASGGQRGAIRIDGQLVGATTDGERVFVTHQNGSSAHPAWTLAAYRPDGTLQWANRSPGALGAPVAQGGLVLSPFLTQWLAILDAKTGRQVTRIRGIDEEITFVRTTSDATWFGSRAGVFRLDVRAASGRRADSTYGTATLPNQLATATYDRDAFDPVQVGYSAFDRKRVLWRGSPTTDGPLAFERDAVVVHFFRFMFGLTPSGELRWAYSQPRVELVASAHSGSVVVAIAADGNVVAIDPVTGSVQSSTKLDVSGQVLGATFDCDGWAPRGGGETPTTVAALVSIARDRDARFDEIKQFAVASLAKLGGPGVAKDLLSIVQDPRTPIKLRDSVVELLVARKDVEGLPVLIAALEPRFDFIAGSEPTAVSAIARAIGATGEQNLSAELRSRAVEQLAGHLSDPSTSAVDRLEVIRAMTRMGQGAERAHLRRELLLYRADASFAGEPLLIQAIVAGLAAGGAEDRETLRYVANDARTQSSIAALVMETLK
jgi:outer membrane protein assembly factor BamB